MLPGARAKITNWCSGSFLLIRDLKILAKFIRPGQEPEPEPETQLGFAAPWREPKEIILAPQHWLRIPPFTLKDPASQNYVDPS